MNNFFTPQAAATPTITNFETGQVYTAQDVFRNLFNNKMNSTKMFGSGDEWELEQDVREALNLMMFDRYYAIGTTDCEPSEEQMKVFKSQRAELVHFLLYDQESPLNVFKKTYRKFFVAKEFNVDGLLFERKGLNLEALEKCLGISLPQELAAYADSFHLSGESGDWYMQTASQEIGSMCFEDTQIKTLVKFIRRVLNAQTRAEEQAAMRFGEGFNEDRIRQELTNQFLVSMIVDNALANCPRDIEVAVCFRKYGHWSAELKSRSAYESAKSDVFEFDNLQEAQEYVKTRNRMEKAEQERVKNIDRIAELKAELAECLKMTASFDYNSDEATAESLKAQKLARPLQAS